MEKKEKKNRKKEHIKEKDKNWIRICPQCKSKEVVSRGAISRQAVSSNYLCLSCGFQAPVFPEVTLEEATKYPDGKRNLTPSRMPIFADRKPYSQTEKRVMLIIIILLGVYLLSLAISLILSFFK